MTAIRAARAPSQIPVLRLAILALAAVACVAGAAGLTAQEAFDKYSNLKWAVTVFAPLAVAMIAVTERPLKVVVALLVALAPFTGMKMTMGDTELYLMDVLLVSGVALAIGTGPVLTSPSSTLAKVGAMCAVVMIVPIASGIEMADHIRVVLALLVTAWLVSLVACQAGGARLVAWAFVAGAALQTLLALYQFKTGSGLDFYGSKRSGFGSGSGYYFTVGDTARPPGAFADPISLGNMLAIALPMTFALALSARKSVEAQLAMGSGLLIAFGLALTQSRMSWVGAVVGLIIALAVVGRGGRKRALPALAALAIGATVLGAATVGPELADRASSISDPAAQQETGYGDRVRQNIWHDVVDVIEDKPLTGTGFGKLAPIINTQEKGADLDTHAHSTYLQIVAEVGLPGALLLLALLIALPIDLRRALKGPERVMAAGAAGVAICLLICWLTDTTIRQPMVAVMFGAALGLIAGLGRRARDPEARPA